MSRGQIWPPQDDSDSPAIPPEYAVLDMNVPRTAMAPRPPRRRSQPGALSVFSHVAVGARARALARAPSPPAIARARARCLRAALAPPARRPARLFPARRCAFGACCTIKLTIVL